MATVSNEFSAGNPLVNSLTQYAPPIPTTLPKTKVRASAKSRSKAIEKRNSPAPQQAPEPKQSEPRYGAGINWYTFGWVALLHVGALAAPFTFSWQGLVVLLVLHWITGGIGICLGYHRLFTHRSFSTYRPISWLIAWIGGLAGEGSAIDWVANHRKHHALSDQEGDPHSPREGAWWSHLLWLVKSMSKADFEAHIQRWSPDLAKDPVMRFLGATFILWHFAAAGLLFAAGYLTGGLYMGFSLMVWGLFLRLICVMHATWFVNSASHMWGYVNYKTTDDSRNNWWVALITYGEGWHNNHHAYPRMANHGHRWWEFDATFRTIRLMERLGLAWDVVDYKHINEKKAAPPRGSAPNAIEQETLTPVGPQTDIPSRATLENDEARPGRARTSSVAA